MPSFTKYGEPVEVDVDIEIEVGEFYDETSHGDRIALAQYLTEDGYLTEAGPSPRTDNILDKQYKEALDKLYTKRIYLTLEEEQFIIDLANRL
jgi:hypothetical protein